MTEQKKDTDPFATLRHELKGPLTTISLYTEAMLSGTTGDLTDEQRDYLSEIAKANKKMIAEVKQLKPKD